MHDVKPDQVPNRLPMFSISDSHGDEIRVIPGGAGFSGLFVVVNNSRDGCAYSLNREETVRLRDWLDTHLATHTGPNEPASRDDRCGWCGHDHLAEMGMDTNVRDESVADPS
ncbi:hypothetical protein Q8791_22980 [Nocardiopsis sp. CT-R113]|uniref:Uncharacterized protein n=1 Tax=Nocardiopsis codii TaxID=3065942 RepID=A0ABU7KCX3_9ACTN|nr:hypothetical protein [Nocardiopsis sp. CT-R113]MEE2040085.1 hypothetical protein [Nocardiopsis sp. CT-R113]